MEATRTKVIQTFVDRNDEERNFAAMQKSGFFPSSVLSDSTLIIPEDLLCDTIHGKIFLDVMESNDVLAMLDLTTGEATMTVFTDGSFADSDKLDKSGTSRISTSSVVFGQKSIHNRATNSRGTASSFVGEQEAAVDALLHIPKNISAEMQRIFRVTHVHMLIDNKTVQKGVNDPKAPHPHDIGRVNILRRNALIQRHTKDGVRIESHHIYSHMNDLPRLTPEKQAKVSQWKLNTLPDLEQRFSPFVNNVSGWKATAKFKSVFSMLVSGNTLADKLASKKLKELQLDPTSPQPANSIVALTCIDQFVIIPQERMQTTIMDFVGYAIDGNKNKSLYERVDLSDFDRELDEKVEIRHLPKGVDVKLIQPNKSQNFNNPHGKHEFHQKGFQYRVGRAETNEKMFEHRSAKPPKFKIISDSKKTGKQTPLLIVERIKHLQTEMKNPKSLSAMVAVKNNQLKLRSRRNVAPKEPIKSVYEMINAVFNVDQDTEDKMSRVIQTLILYGGSKCHVGNNVQN